MWPYKKETKTTCMSGVLTCDGRHHAWSDWQDVILKETAWRKGMTKPMEFLADAQERTCLICRYKERRMVDED